MNNYDFSSKTIAIAGATGVLGSELCLNLCKRGVKKLIILYRSEEKAEWLKNLIKKDYLTEIQTVYVPLDSIFHVKNAVNQIKSAHVFIYNAGVYGGKREETSFCHDTCFTTNFVAPYFMAKALREENPKIKIVAVGSIAYRLSEIDSNDISLSSCKRHMKIYGNSKRYLMLSLSKLFEKSGNFSLVHPGITPTNITRNYPKAIQMLIKYPMRFIFTSPKKSCENIISGIVNDTPFGSWIGPRVLGVWGKPKLKPLKICSTPECEKAFETAESIYRKLK